MQSAESGSRQSCETFAVSNPLHIEHTCMWVHVFVFSPTFTLSCRVCRTQKGSSFIMCVASPITLNTGLPSIPPNTEIFDKLRVKETYSVSG